MQVPQNYPVNKEFWKILEKMDSYTYNHSIRVMQLAQMVEGELRLPDNHLSAAGLLHDIGKYYISSNILDKHAELTPTERQAVDFHSFYSYLTLSRFDFPPDICQMALLHHGPNPPVASWFTVPEVDEHTKNRALMLQTIDMFEALTSDRPYHRRRTREEAVNIITDSIKIYEPHTLCILLSGEEG